MLSVLLAVYVKERADYLDAALESIALQTLQPDEVVLAVDPLGPELIAIIDSYRTRLPLKIVQLPSSQGLGMALRVGVEQCSGDLIARMDTDDICVRDRLRKQVDFLAANPDIDLVGGNIAEFDDDPLRPTTIRRVPEFHGDIARSARFRCPVNHMAVMYRRAAVLRAGNYQEDRRQEDYKLWARMLLAGSRFHNLQVVLVLARTGNGMIRRRGGVAFMKSELRLQAYFIKIGFTSIPQLFFNLLARVPVLVAPHSARQFMYQYFLRREVPPEVNYL